MEAPATAPPPPLSTTASAATVVAPSTYPDSVSSSPRSRLTDSWDADAPPTAPPQKLRLMCSYGGHIIPRPHDKTLCYIGGDTRIIVIDRQTSLADLHHRLSKTLLHNQEFSLKYQLPNEDLDSLISVTTEEDLENMVEEYDRLNNATRGLKPGRLRLFLFPKSSSIEHILQESASTKSEDWFLNALNGGKATASDRGHSESSSVNCLLGLDDDLLGKSSAVKDVEAQLEGKKSSIDGIGNVNNNSVINQDAHSVPDSPMLETFSSFGSTSSSPSMVNLPPIRVRLEENPKPGMVGMDEHFQQLTVGFGGDPNLMRTKQQEVEGLVAEVPGAVVSGMPMPVVVGGEYVNRVQAPLQQQQIIHYQLKQGGAVDLASPDSVSSEGSITNALSRQRQAIYQEHVRNNRVNINPVDLKTWDQNNSTGHTQPQVPESGYVLSSQFDQNHPQLHQQQQFVHAGMQYIPAGAMPIASYYPMYPMQQQHHPHQPLLEQQYPVYFMPARHAQAYNLPVQPPNYNELTPNSPSSRPQMPPPPPTAAAPLGAYNPAGNAASQLEIASGVYRTTASSAPVRVPISQNQTQYVGFTQVHHPQQAVAPSAPLNSIYEFADPAHAQMYYTQPLPPQLAAQYQTLAPEPAMALPEATAQLPTENLKQQVRTSQP